MGKISQGILGGFSGKVGNVIGATWKGIDYMRIKPSSVANPRTPGQLDQRSKFATVLRFLQPMTDFLRVGFRLYANKMTQFNNAMSYNLNNAVTCVYAYSGANCTPHSGETVHPIPDESVHPIPVKVNTPFLFKLTL